MTTLLFLLVAVLLFMAGFTLITLIDLIGMVNRTRDLEKQVHDKWWEHWESIRNKSKTIRAKPRE
mgnify:CR=1 FL=1